MTTEEDLCPTRRIALNLLRLRLGVSLEWHVGDVVRKLRERRRWNQQKLAVAAKLNRSTVVAVEEHAPGIKRETYESVARAFGISVGQLFSLVPSDGASSRPHAIQGADAAERRAASESFRDESNAPAPTPRHKARR